MNFDSLSANPQADPSLMHFIETESQRQRFQALVHSLTNSCWDICMTGTPGSKMDGKTQTCLSNCVNRFIDASAFIVKRLESVGKQHLQ